jgi:hypothetical protein
LKLFKRGVKLTDRTFKVGLVSGTSPSDSSFTAFGDVFVGLDDQVVSRGSAAAAGLTYFPCSFAFVGVSNLSDTFVDEARLRGAGFSLESDILRII